MSLPRVRTKVFFVLLMFLVVAYLFNSKSIRRMEYSIKAKPATENYHLLFPITNISDTRYCRSVASAINQGYTPRLLLMPDTGNFLHNTMLKIVTVYNYIRDEVRSESDIILLLDAFDTLVQEPPLSLLNKFYAKGAKIIFAAEKLCWPMQNHTRACCDLPESTLPVDVYGDLTDTETKYTRPRSINSGVIIGYKSHMERLYRHAVLYQNVFHAFNGAYPAGGDQGIFASLAVSDPSYKIMVDHESEISHTMQSAVHDISRHRDGKQLVFSKLSKSTPSVLHYNGGAWMKSFMAESFAEHPWVVTSTRNSKKLQYSAELLQKLGERHIAVNSSMFSYQDLCGSTV